MKALFLLTAISFLFAVGCTKPDVKINTPCMMKAGEKCFNEMKACFVVEDDIDDGTKND